MQQKDWTDFKTAKHCHICEKDLVKEEFLDSEKANNTKRNISLRIHG